MSEFEPNQEFKIVTGRLSLEEMTVQQLQAMAQEAMRQARTSMLEVTQTAYAEQNFSLMEEIMDLEKQTLDVGVVHLGDYWTENDSNEVYTAPTTTDGEAISDGFTITAFNVKSGLMLCRAYGPDIPHQLPEDRYFEYRLDFLAHYNVHDQDIQMLWSNHDNATHPHMEALEAEFRSLAPIELQ